MARDAVEVLERGTASRLRLRVKPGARRTGPVAAHGGALKVEVAAPPERGKANEAVLRLVAELVGVDRRRVRLVSGASSPDKLVEIEGSPAAVTVAALARTGLRAQAVAGRSAPHEAAEPSR